MVAPLVVYGAWALGGVVAGALGTWGVSKLLEDDAKRLRQMEKQYETEKAAAEIRAKQAKSQAEALAAQIEEAKLKLKLAQILEEANLARLRAAEAEKKALDLEAANRARK